MKFLILLAALILVPSAMADCIQKQTSEYGGMYMSTSGVTDIQATISMRHVVMAPTGMLMAWISIGDPTAYLQVGLMVMGNELSSGPSVYSEQKEPGPSMTIAGLTTRGYIQKQFSYSKSTATFEIRKIGDTWFEYINGKEVGSLRFPGTSNPIELLVESQGDCSSTGLFIFKDVKVIGASTPLQQWNNDQGFQVATISNGFVVAAQPRSY